MSNKSNKKSAFLNYKKTAIKKLRRHLRIVHGYQQHGFKDNQAIKIFADLYGYTIKGNYRDWLVNLYLSKSDDIVRQSDGLFYSSKEWRELRIKVLNSYENCCMKCGDTEYLCVDHIKPYSLFPEFKLDFDNMQILCKICNLVKSNRNCNDYRPKN